MIEKADTPEVLKSLGDVVDLLP